MEKLTPIYKLQRQILSFYSPILEPCHLSHPGFTETSRFYVLKREANFNAEVFGPLAGDFFNHNGKRCANFNSQWSSSPEKILQRLVWKFEGHNQTWKFASWESEWEYLTWNTLPETHALLKSPWKAWKAFIWTNYQLIDFQRLLLLVSGKVINGNLVIHGSLDREMGRRSYWFLTLQTTGLWDWWTFTQDWGNWSASPTNYSTFSVDILKRSKEFPL